VSPITWWTAGQGQADRVGEHLRHDRRGALADLLRAVVEEKMRAVRASMRSAPRIVDGLAITVLPMPYHMQAMPAPRRSVPVVLSARGPRRRRDPSLRSR
jgi:hypothetical protein